MGVFITDLTTSNPLDNAEQIMMSREWAFDRPLEDELIAEFAGQWCNYRIWFTWQSELEAVMFSCAYDLKIPDHQRARVYPLVMLANERLWLGHFDICSEDGSVIFRHSSLLKGGVGMSALQIGELVDIAIDECERFYPAFQSVMWANQAPADALRFAMFETFGEA